MNWLEICKEIGKDVSDEVMPIYRSGHRSNEVGTKGFGGDLTLEADRKAEDIFLERLGSLDAKIFILTEESGVHEVEKPDFYAVIDPIDGSFNFKTGTDYFCASIAILDPKYNPVFAYIKNLPSGDEYWASPEGAFKNGKPIKSSTAEKPEKMIYEKSHLAKKVDVDMLAKAHTITHYTRTLGAIALDFCKIAEGSFDAVVYMEASRFLDIVAGEYILKQAGGIVCDLGGNEKISEGLDLVAKDLIIAGNGRIRDALLK
jgi:myo-inositol-1(or 4)-monophosphatase